MSESRIQVEHEQCASTFLTVFVRLNAVWVSASAEKRKTSSISVQTEDSLLDLVPSGHANGISAIFFETIQFGELFIRYEHIGRLRCQVPT
jgi:hypothetical protein